MADPSHSTPPLVTRDAEVLGGAVVFAGTRVPFSTFIEYLEGGDSIREFLADFPSVKLEQAIAALELLRDAATGGENPSASSA